MQATARVYRNRSRICHIKLESLHQRLPRPVSPSIVQPNMFIKMRDKWNNVPLSYGKVLTFAALSAASIVTIVLSSRSSIRSTYALDTHEVRFGVLIKRNLRYDATITMSNTTNLEKRNHLETILQKIEAIPNFKQSTGIALKSSLKNQIKRFTDVQKYMVRHGAELSDKENKEIYTKLEEKYGTGTVFFQEYSLKYVGGVTSGMR